MSEYLRQLVVSLSLDSDNFARNMRTINQQIKEAESSFRLAGAGVDNFENTVQGAQSKVSMLKDKLTQQNRAVDQYSRALDAANKKLTDSYTRQGRLEEKLTDARSELTRTKLAVDSASKTYKSLASSLGESDSATIAARQNLEAAAQEYADAAAEVKKLEGQLKSNSKTLQNNADAISKAKTNLNNAKAAVRDTEAEIVKTNKSLKTMQSVWTSAGKAMETFGTKCQSVGKSMTSTGKVVTATVTTPIVALGTAAAEASIEYESAFASVSKTVDATEEEYASLSGEIKQMSTVVATGADDIAEVVAIAGQLGIANDYLTGFSRTMIDLGNSTDIVADEAASTLAKFANITGMNQAQFSNLGSTLVDLGNKYATTESEIMNMAMRLAGAGHQVGLSEAQILGFAAALSSVGIEAEMGGSAFSKALTKMEVAAATGGEALDDFAEVSGMTAKQFKALWDADPAAAFQAFIVGLARMDEAGESAIATLQEIGISEVRLRDTLLRSVNATELFAETQETANRAWEENSALTVEANKRYATTESRLKNLKNTATLFAQRIGDDLNPTINNLIDGATGLLEKFMSLDEEQRMMIIQFAAVAAAAGPVLAILGKLNSGVGTVVSAVGKFSTAVGKAGGGFGGFMKTLAKSPSVWFAVAAGVIAGTVALVDYATGAKKAREAMEGMQERAEAWKNTAAETFYGKSEGLSFFGMSESDFQRAAETDAQAAQDWVDGVIAVWTDGKRESDEIVSEWTNSFKTLTDSTRAELLELQGSDAAANSDAFASQLARDIALLDAMDTEIEALLKKRQSRHFTEEEKIRLQELIDTREAIEVKYRFVEDVDGFDTIARKLEAADSRARALGKDRADISVYENAIVAAAEGMAAITAELDAQYDSEYAAIQLLEDEEARTEALVLLNRQYSADRTAAATEYAELLQGIVMPVWNQADIQQAASNVDTLAQKLREYSALDAEGKKSMLGEFENLAASMDEGALTEYISMLTQIQSLLDNGMPESDVQAMFPQIDFSDALIQLASIQEFFNNNQWDANLTSLSSMFGEALPEEVLKIATDLDMTGAQARWNEFASNPGAITTQAVIESYAMGLRAKEQRLRLDAFVENYLEVPEGAGTDELHPLVGWAYVQAYAEANGNADVSNLTPEVTEAVIKAYTDLGSDGTDLSALTINELYAKIIEYSDADADLLRDLSIYELAAIINAYEDEDAVADLEPQVAAKIVSFMGENGIDISQMSDEDIVGMVNVLAQLTGLSGEVIQQAVNDAMGGQPYYLNTRLSITGYDQLAYNAFMTANANDPIQVKGIVRLGETAYASDPQAVTNDPNAQFWMGDVQVPVTAVPTERLTASTLCVLDDDGTLHVLVTPEITGSPEAVDAAEASLHSEDHQGSIGAKMFSMDTLDDLRRLNEYLSGIEDEFENPVFKFLDFAGWGTSYNRWASKNTTSNYLDADEFANLQIYAGEAVAAIASGQPATEEMLGNLQMILELLTHMKNIGFGDDHIGDFAAVMTEAGLETTSETLIPNLESLIEQASSVGADVASGIGEGMASADMSTYGATVADNTETALRGASAFDSASPANRTKPVGRDVALGVGVGMAETNLSSYANITAAHIMSAFNAKLNANAMRSTGIFAMAGLTAGINAGRSGVISAMRSAAQAAVNAAKAQLDIHSPSRVFEDEVGVMTMRGWGVGVLKETKKQARTIRNATRYLTSEAMNGSTAPASNDNRRTYNQNSTISFAGSHFHVRDSQDAYALAVEIAALTRRQQRGRGMRMA